MGTCRAAPAAPVLPRHACPSSGRAPRGLEAPAVTSCQAFTSRAAFLEVCGEGLGSLQSVRCPHLVLQPFEQSAG